MGMPRYLLRGPPAGCMFTQMNAPADSLFGTNIIHRFFGPPMENPLVTGVGQVCIVANDADATMKHLYEVAGIGPWAVWTPPLTNMRIRGVETPYSMKLALAWTGGFCWEVIQPLEGPSIYREFLAEKGEGVHHLLIANGNHSYEETIAEATRKGCPPLMEGHWAGVDFAYLETDGPLKVVLEIFRRPAGVIRPKPDYWYPFAGELPAGAAND